MADAVQVTVGDVSARAGVSVFQAEQCLQALAADAQGTLQVLLCTHVAALQCCLHPSTATHNLMSPCFLIQLRCVLCLQVSTEGDVVYVLPRGFRGIITSRSFWLRTEPLFKKVPPSHMYFADENTQQIMCSRLINRVYGACWSAS